MNKYAKKIGCLLIIGAVAIQAVGCKKSETPPQSLVDYELWSAPATERVLRDVEAETYVGIKAAPALSVDTATNEYESGQIIISADSEVKSYTVEVSDLTSSDGETLYAKENVEVYNLKYAYVTSPQNEGARIGWYPDCLLPFDAAVKAGENKVAAGENQAIWFLFNTPMEQPAGVYTGNAKVSVNGEENIVPVTVRVRNVAVNEANHSASAFLNEWFYRTGEYDGTQAMYDKYNKKLMEYRVMPGNLVMDSSKLDEDAEYYADKAYELCSGEECSSILLPIAIGSNGITGDSAIRYLTAMANKSLETGCNLIKKCYMLGVDEPISNNAYEQQKKVYDGFMAQRHETVIRFEQNKETYLAEHPEVTEEYYDEVVTAIGEVYQVVTTKYREDYALCVDVFCPPFPFFDAGYVAGHYDNEERLWIYGALTGNPYPNYHTEGSLVAMRMIGWLQSYYNIDGSLYWATTVYAELVGGKGYYYLDEYYEDATRFNQFSGEGSLFYPGKKYGVDGPLASIRLEAIRDGYEEFELLYNIKEKYAEISAASGVEFSADSTIEALLGGLHSGWQISATPQTFASARKSLLDLSEFTESGVCFIDYSDNGEGLIEYKAFIPDSKTLTATGINEISSQGVVGGKIVTYQVDTNTSSVADAVIFTTNVNGEQVSISYQLPGRVTKYNAETLLGGIVSGVNASALSLVDAAAINGEDGKLLYLPILAAESNTTAFVRFKDLTLLSNINAKTNKVAFNFYYNDETVTLPVMIYVKYKNKTYDEAISSSLFTFKKGMNTIVCDSFDNINWERNGEIEYLTIEVGEINGGTVENSFYWKNVVIYDKKEVG